MKKVLKILKKALFVIYCVSATLLITWIILSYLEVTSKNLTENPQYLAYNLFELLL